MTDVPDIFRISETPPTPAELPYDEKERLIINAYVDRALTVEEIAAEYCLPLYLVKQIAKRAGLNRRALQIQRKVSKAIFQDKAPIMEAVADIGLMGLYEWIYLFFRSGRHRNMTVREAKSLGEFISKMDELYRLNVGKPTAILQHHIQETKIDLAKILEQIRKAPEEGGDPFCDPVDVEFSEVKNGTDPS